MPWSIAAFTLAARLFRQVIRYRPVQWLLLPLFAILTVISADDLLRPQAGTALSFDTAGTFISTLLFGYATMRIVRLLRGRQDLPTVKIMTTDAMSKGLSYVPIPLIDRVLPSDNTPFSKIMFGIGGIALGITLVGFVMLGYVPNLGAALFLFVLVGPVALLTFMRLCAVMGVRWPQHRGRGSGRHHPRADRADVRHTSQLS